MISHMTDNFRKKFSRLPNQVQDQAKETYHLFKNDPYHSSLHFKRVHSRKPVYSVRINIDYRAVGIFDGAEIVWFWIGPHSEYDTLLKKLKST